MPVAQGSNSVRSTSPSGHRAQRVLAAVAALSLLVPLGVAIAALGRATGTDIEFTDRERDGVAYLRPMTRLLAATVDAQEAAVTGRAATAKGFESTVGDVDAVSGELDDVLRLGDAWPDLKERIDAVVESQAVGADAYTPYSALIELELKLITDIGDNSNLILDPELDAYYVMDATLIRVPAILVQMGRASDLTAFAQQTRASGRSPSAQTADDFELAAAVALSEVRSDIAAVDGGLKTSLRETTSRTLGPGLLNQSDRFTNAVTSFAPPTHELGVASEAFTAEELRTNRAAAKQAALEFDSAALTELDLLFQARRDRLVSQRNLVLLATGLSLAVGAGALGWLIRLRRRRRQVVGADAGFEEPVAPSAQATPVGAAGATGQGPL